ncbi:MAG: response regulator [Leptothrix sp. (in: b-proteobacteria)]
MTMPHSFAPTAPMSLAPHRIGVFIAEDHRITLWGLERLIEGASARMHVVGTATSKRELLDHVAIAQADIVLLDLDLGGDDSLSAMRELQRRCPGHILVLTGDTDTERHREAVVQGARGVLHKSQSAEVLLTAIEKVHAGEIWLERSLLGQVLGHLTGAPRAPRPEDLTARRIASLTPREREVIAALMSNAGAKQLALAERLGMSENTLRNHLTTIYSKLAVRGRLELHVFATEHGLAGTDGRRTAG